MYTYGYIKEATMAHIDLDEQEAQAMRLQERYHIFANEAMQTICGSKPKYDYFKCKGVSEYALLINLGNNEFRLATEAEINWEHNGLPKPNFADEIDTKKWHNTRDIYLLNEPIRLPDDFIAFAEKQAFVIEEVDTFKPELFLAGYTPSTLPYKRRKATKEDFMYTGKNSITLYNEVEYFIPYKGVWFRFISGMGDEVEIDMPIDIFLTIPLYVASICLEQDHQQKAATKRAQFERALANCTATDFLDLKSV